MSTMNGWLSLSLALGLSVGCDRTEMPLSGSEPHDTSLETVMNAGVLTWGADVVGGIPYVFEDSEHKGSYIGFEMDIAKAIARHLGVEQRMVVTAWDALIPELQKGSFDMAMNGIEDLDERGKIVLFSDPYYVYTQQLTVRRDTVGVARLDDLKGKKVATLSGSAAEDILRATPGIAVHISPEIVYSYQELEAGRVDAVLLDTPIAAAYGTSNPKLKNVGESFGEGRYVIAFRRQGMALRTAVNRALAEIKRSGELRRIYERWHIMDQYQAQIAVL